MKIHLSLFLGLVISTTIFAETQQAGQGRAKCDKASLDRMPPKMRKRMSSICEASARLRAVNAKSAKSRSDERARLKAEGKVAMLRVVKKQGFSAPFQDENDDAIIWTYKSHHSKSSRMTCDTYHFSKDGKKELKRKIGYDCGAK